MTWNYLGRRHKRKVSRRKLQSLVLFFKQHSPCSRKVEEKASKQEKESEQRSKQASKQERRKEKEGKIGGKKKSFVM